MALAFNPTTTRFDLTNALFLAQCSDLAYQSKTAIKKTTTDWGFPRGSMFDRNDTQAFISANDAAIVIAFRGTESREDWMTDAAARLIKYPPSRVHRGFVNAFRPTIPWLKEALKRFKDNAQTIWLTGHSLGAALATLAADHLLDSHEIAGLYTFGSPRVGDGEFAGVLDDLLKARHFRFVNNEDIVTRLPPREAGYNHCGTVRYFDNDGKMHAENIWIQQVLDVSRSSEVRTEARYKELRHQNPNFVEDHSMGRYIANIKKNLPKGVLTFKDYING